MKIYEPLYWNGEGKYQKEYDYLRKELVPDSGDANTIEGQVIRYLGNIYYDHFNNGGGNLGGMKEYWVKPFVKLLPVEMRADARKFSAPLLCWTPYKRGTFATTIPEGCRFADDFVDRVVEYVMGRVASGLTPYKDEVSEQ